MSPKRKKRKGPRKVSLKTQIRRLMKKADRALSVFARADAIIKFAGKCPFCGRDPILPVPSKDGKKMRKNGWVCFHFVRRRRKSVRWELINVVGACAFCNRIEVGNPDPYRAWYIRKFGHEQYLMLVDESAKTFEPDVAFLNSVVEKFTAAFKALGNENQPPA